MITGLDHVQVSAPPGCEPAARAFFTGLLGLPELDKPEELSRRGGAWFGAGEQQLHVGVEEGGTPARKAHPALRLRSVEDLEELGRRLLAAGRPVSWDAAIPGTRRFYTEDPWGNRLELLAPDA